LAIKYPISMKRTLLFTSMLIVAGMFSLEQINSSPTGTPSPAAGGPAEGGTTCFQGGCHVGSPVNVNNIITTNIPAAGYTPGASYTITVTITGSGNKGFQVSPQKTDGTPMGTLTPGGVCWIPFSNYITHTAPKSTTTAVWNFTWQAPVAGSGALNFYGAFAITRNNTRRQVLTVQENLSAGVSESAGTASIGIFPNPAANFVTVSFPGSAKGCIVTLIGIDGRKAHTLYEGDATGADLKLSVEDVPEGVYVLELAIGNSVQYRKMLVSR
jgi:type IX secretion system substrate protein